MYKSDMILPQAKFGGTSAIEHEPHQHQRMRIYVVCFTGNSGLTHYSVSLCRELGRHADVTLITAESFDPALRSPAFHVATLFRRTRHLPVDLLRFVRFVRGTRPDAVLFQSVLRWPLLDALLVRIFRRAGIGTALTVHDVQPHHPWPWSRWSYAKYFSSFDRLVVHSARSCSEVKAMAPASPVLQVPHGVYDIFDTQHLSREQVLDRFPEIAPDEFVFLFFGKLDERKGILELLDAAERMAPAMRAKVLIAGHVGASPEAANVRTRLTAARSNRAVVIHEGYVPFERVQEYFTRADVVVVPYREGTTSGVLKLAMAFRKPVIATDIGDLAETVSEGFGILLDRTNLARDLPYAMETAANNYNALKTGCASVARKYDWGEIARAYFEFLHDGHGSQQ